ncbi:MAG: hypothetical protein M5R36_21675 [Deltaproteobacteria bacterium]|nr:hypothetical protein [Deltaproteobacteria bacterium]
MARPHDGRGYFGTAMIPDSYHRALAGGRLKKGDLVLAASVGAGVSYGAIVLRVP